jgi:hypothetical protein
MAQRVEVVFTDVSGQPINPNLGVQETKSFGFFILSRNVGKNYRYSLRKNPEERISHTLLGGILKSRRRDCDYSRFSLVIGTRLRTNFPSFFVHV